MPMAAGGGSSSKPKKKPPKPAPSPGAQQLAASERNTAAKSPGYTGKAASAAAKAAKALRQSQQSAAKHAARRERERVGGTGTSDYALHGRGQATKTGRGGQAAKTLNFNKSLSQNFTRAQNRPVRRATLRDSNQARRKPTSGGVSIGGDFTTNPRQKTDGRIGGIEPLKRSTVPREFSGGFPEFGGGYRPPPAYFDDEGGAGGGGGGGGGATNPLGASISGAFEDTSLEELVHGNKKKGRAKRGRKTE